MKKYTLFMLLAAMAMVPYAADAKLPREKARRRAAGLPDKAPKKTRRKTKKGSGKKSSWKTFFQKKSHGKKSKKS